MADNFDNYSMKVQARVDMPSNKDIDAQIRKLEKSISKLKVSGQFDDTALKNLTNQLNSLKATISTANFSPTALTELTNQVNRALQNINIGNINVGNIGNQAQQAGQQIGKLISDSAEQAISNVSSKNIGRYFRIDSSTSNQFRAEMEKLVSEWTNAKGKLTDLNIQTRTSYDKDADANITRLHQATVTYKNELDEVIKKTIAWRQIGTTTNDEGEKKILRGFVEVAGQYSKSLDTATAKTDNFVKKQKEAVANLQNTINQITSRAFDSNASKPITSDASLDKLNTQVANVENAMNNLRNATSTTFDDAKIKVQEEISQLKILEKELRNADNVSTKMKGTDVTSGLAIAKNDLEKFKADAKDFPQITQTIKDLDTAISKVGDASSINSFNDSLRVARSELAKIKSETNASNRNEKVGINTSGLQSKIADLQKISPEIDKFETEINGAKVTVQSLLSDLSKISTQSDFSVVSAKFNAFTKAAEASGIAIRDFGNVTDSITKKANEIQLSFANGDYEAKVESTIAKTQQWRDENGNARISTEQLRTALANLGTAYNNLNTDGGDTIANQKALKQAESELSAEIKKVTNDVTKMNAEYAKSSKVESLHQKLTEFYDKNSATHKKWGTELKQMMDATASGAKVTNSELLRMELRYKQIGNEARQAGKLGLSFFDGIVEQAKKFTQWVSVASVVTEGVQAVKQLISVSKELDAVMTDFTMATGTTGSKLEALTESYSKLADKLKSTTTDVMTSATEWIKQGQSIADTETLVSNSMILSKIGKLDSADATKYLTSAMKGYKVSVDDTLSVVDKLSAVDMASATDVGGLAEGMSEVAASADLAGVSMDKLLGYLAAIGETTQSGMSEVGTTLNAVFSRMGNIKLSRLKDYDNNGEDLSNVETVLRGVGISLRDSANSFRDFDKVLDETASNWNNYSEVQQRAIASAFAG